jgi:hypothetical protein
VLGIGELGFRLTTNNSYGLLSPLKQNIMYLKIHIYQYTEVSLGLKVLSSSASSSILFLSTHCPAVCSLLLTVNYTPSCRLSLRVPVFFSSREYPLPFHFWPSFICHLLCLSVASQQFPAGSYDIVLLFHTNNASQFHFWLIKPVDFSHVSSEVNFISQWIIHLFSSYLSHLRYTC